MEENKEKLDNKQNKKEKKIKEHKQSKHPKLKLISLVIVVLIFLIIAFIILYNHFHPKYIDYLTHSPSGQHMIIAEETYDTTYNENLKDKKTIYYFVFNKNGQCTACFATLINNEVIGGAKQGFIDPRKIGNDTYVELPAYKVFTLEEIQQMIENNPYTTKLAEW